MGYVPLMFFPGIPVPEHQFPGNSRVPGKYIIYKKKKTITKNKCTNVVNY